jgi:hypothetical protein
LGDGKGTLYLASPTSPPILDAACFDRRWMRSSEVALDSRMIVPSDSLVDAPGTKALRDKAHWRWQAGWRIG